MRRASGPPAIPSPAKALRNTHVCAHAHGRTRTLSPEGSADSKPVPRIGREEGAGPHGRANQDPDSALEKGNEQWRSIAQLSILLPWQHTAPSSWPCHHTATEGTPVWTGCEGHRAGGAPCCRPVLLLPPGSCSPAYTAARRERACGRRAAPAARGPVRTATAAPPGRYSLRLHVRHCQLLPSRFQKQRLARPGERAGGVLGSRPFRRRPSRTRTPLDGSPRGLSGSSCSSRFHFLNVRGLTRFVRKQTVFTQQCPETDACVLTRSAASAYPFILPPAAAMGIQGREPWRWRRDGPRL